jgi:hypothetical protein
MAEQLSAALSHKSHYNMCVTGGYKESLSWKVYPMKITAINLACTFQDKVSTCDIIVTVHGKRILLILS